MNAAAKEQERAAQVVALAAGHDPKRLRLSAAEGYLLSRIDGRTPWRLLREIGGIPPSEVDACLERWLAEGVVEIVAGAAKSGAASPKPPRIAMDAASAPKAATPKPIVIDPQLLDPALDIDCDVQRRILEFELSLSRPYHELLGVPVGADPKTVKRAYFKLSKEFHPDRYFRKQIGPYTQRLERIFKKVLEAHEILSDPELCQVQNQTEGPMPEAVDVVAAAAATNAASPEPPRTPSSVPGGGRSGVDPQSQGPASTTPTPTPEIRPESKPLSKLDRLRQRMPFKIDHAAMAARRARALEIFRAAEASLEAGRFNEAEAGIRIAITFDPSRAEFKEALGALRIRAAGDRAMKLLATPSDRMSENELRDALQLIEDVLPYRPHDPELNVRAALVCLQLGRYDEAVEYVETLLEGAPDVASHHALRGRIERARGDLKAAKKAFSEALELDPDDLEARRALASMRIAAHDAAQGGRR
ncbi:MAG: tetratricopeptide repeat protein [Myxococcota bacterium]